MTLKPDFRSVIVLRHFLECSYQDMAEILSLPEKTVKSRLFAARQLLAEALRKDGVA
jgi:RNA polymerase sigma-70 factor (ECF subfamily)